MSPERPRETLLATYQAPMWPGTRVRETWQAIRVEAPHLGTSEIIVMHQGERIGEYLRLKTAGDIPQEFVDRVEEAIRSGR